MILLYKDIKVEKENDESIDICDFERQMFQLSTKNIVTLEDYSGSDLNKIVITFDDLLNSKKEVFERVLEILRKYNYKFYVFICLSDVLNENECLSRSKLDEIVHSGGVIGWKGGVI